jgi:hypothetical protein
MLVVNEQNVFTAPWACTRQGDAEGMERPCDQEPPVSTDRIGAIQALLEQTEAAHGIYETTELDGTYDQDWPAWYARYAVDHGLSDLVGRALTAEEVTGVLEHIWDDPQRADPKPSEPWAAYAARRLAEEPPTT